MWASISHLFTIVFSNLEHELVSQNTTGIWCRISDPEETILSPITTHVVLDNEIALPFLFSVPYDEYIHVWMSIVVGAIFSLDDTWFVIFKLIISGIDDWRYWTVLQCTLDVGWIDWNRNDIWETSNLFTCVE